MSLGVQGDGGSSRGEKDVAVGQVGEGLVLDAQKETALTNPSGFGTLTPKHVFVKFYGIHHIISMVFLI